MFILEILDNRAWHFLLAKKAPEGAMVKN